jgi:hypothetical protein
VDMVSSMLHRAGDTVAMMEVLVRPPSESCRMRVSLLSLCVKGEEKEGGVGEEG